MRRGVFRFGAILLLMSIGTRLAAQPPAAKLDPAFKLDLYGDPMPRGAMVRFGTVALRHRFGLYMSSLAYAPDGKTIAMPNGDHVRVWNLERQQVVGVFRIDPPAPGSTWRYRQIAYSPDGSLFAASVGTVRSDAEESPANRLFVWNAATRSFLRALNRPRVASFCFCGDNRTVAVAEESRVTFWDLTTGRESEQAWPLPRAVGGLDSLAFVPESRTILAGDSKGSIHFRKIGDGGDRSAEGMLFAKAYGSHLAGAPRGKTFAFGTGVDLTLADAETGKSIASLNHGDQQSVYSVAFSPDGSLLASSWNVNEIDVWGLPAAKKLRTIRIPVSATQLQFSPDGKTLCGSCNGTLLFWDPLTGKSLHARDAHTGSVRQIAFSPEGDRLATQGDDMDVRIWDVTTGKQIRRHECQCSGGGEGIAWSSDGSLLATAGAWWPADPEQGLGVWEAKTGKLVRRLTSDSNHYGFRFMPGSKSLLVTDIDGGKLTHRLHDAVTGRDLGEPEPAEVWGFVASRDADRYKALREILNEIQTPKLRLSPEGRWLAYTANGQWFVRLHDLDEGGPPLDLGEGKPETKSFAFAPHGKLIACGREDDTVELWDVATGRKVASFRTGQGSIDAVAFSPDGRSLAAGGADSTILLWSLHDLLVENEVAVDADALWRDLGEDRDVRRAYRAVELLAAKSDASMPLFRERVKPRAPVPAERIERLIADLDAEEFGAREAATRDLIALGDLIGPRLKALRKTNASPEVARRSDAILKRIRQRPDDLRELRAVLALEAIGSADALRLLDELSRGAPAAGVTLEARAALRRLEDRRKAASR
jgi:WD40 repeat protein